MAEDQSGFFFFLFLMAKQFASCRIIWDDILRSLILKKKAKGVLLADKNGMASFWCPLEPRPPQKKQQFLLACFMWTECDSCVSDGGADFIL